MAGFCPGRVMVTGGEGYLNRLLVVLFLLLGEIWAENFLV